MSDSCSWIAHVPAVACRPCQCDRSLYCVAAHTQQAPCGSLRLRHEDSQRRQRRQAKIAYISIDRRSPTGSSRTCDRRNNVPMLRKALLSTLQYDAAAFSQDQSGRCQQAGPATHIDAQSVSVLDDVRFLVQVEHLELGRVPWDGRADRLWCGGLSVGPVVFLPWWRLPRRCAVAAGGCVWFCH